MLAFFVAFLMGVAFMVLLKFLLRALNEEDKKQTLIFFVSLFALCGIFALTAILNLLYITYFFCGLLSGAALTAAGIYIYKNILKDVYQFDIRDINLEFFKKRIKSLKIKRE